MSKDWNVQWTRLEPYMPKRQGVNAVRVRDDTLLYFWGGSNALLLDACYYDAGKDAWSRLRFTWPANDVFPSAKPAVCDAGDFVYIYGGLQDGTEYDYISRDVREMVLLVVNPSLLGQTYSNPLLGQTH